MQEEALLLQPAKRKKNIMYLHKNLLNLLYCGTCMIVIRLYILCLTGGIALYCINKVNDQFLFGSYISDKHYV